MLIAMVLSITQVADYVPVFYPSFRLPADCIVIIGHIHVISHNVETGILAIVTGH